jgi:hypothetical protein
MSGANSFKFVLLPPQSDTTRDWAKRLAEMVPEARVIVAEDADTAAREIVDAEAAFGWLGSDLLLKATRLRWLQAPQAAPPAGYYYPELVAHSVVVTNFREIFNALAALAWLIFDQAGSNKCLSGIRFESGHAIPNDSSHDAALKHKHVARPGGSLRVGLLVASQTDRQTLWSHRNFRPDVNPTRNACYMRT